MTIWVAANTPEAKELIKIRETLGLTIREFAKRVDEPEARYKNYEYGLTKKVPMRVLNKARFLIDGKPMGMTKVSLVFGEMAKVPIVGNVSAGFGNTNVDIVEDEAWVPMSLQKLGGIGYVVDGESMMPSLQPGDVAIFRQMHQPYARFTYLVRTEDAEYRCKNLEWKNNEWTLVSLNPNFRDEPLGGGQLLGMLIGWYRSIGKYEKLEADPDGLRLDAPV